ncbi:MAG: FG-GAP repeat protein [Alphaproteobacteria bacterium]|nr:FG-GAP repeat protein [Alphaproteobacteria bacterium]
MSWNRLAAGVAVCTVVVAATRGGWRSTPAEPPPEVMPAPTHDPSTWQARVQRWVARDAADVFEAPDGLWIRHAAGGAVRVDVAGVAHLVEDVDDTEVAALSTVGVLQGSTRGRLGAPTVGSGPCRQGDRDGCVRAARVDQGAVTTWWEHAAGGLEQGWTVPAPVGSGPLVVEVAVDGAIAWVEEGTLRLGEPDGGWVADAVAAWDADGVALDVDPEVTGEGFALRVDVGEARWPVTVDPVWRPWNKYRQGRGDHDGLGHAVALAGDVDEDGYDDALLGAPGFSGSAASQGRVYLFRGGPGGLATVPSQVWTGVAAGDGLGSTLAFLGDVDGDGHVDAAFGAPGTTSTLTHQGAVWIVHGTGTGLAPAAQVALLGHDADRYFGSVLSTAGDVNGDGYADVLVGSDRVGRISTRIDEVQLHVGGAGGMSPTPLSTWSLGRFNRDHAFAGLGDVDGDGFDDMALVQAVPLNRWALQLYRGGPSGPAAVPDLERDLSLGTGTVTGMDVDGDGLSDVITALYGTLSVWRGEAGGLATTPERLSAIYAGDIRVLAGGGDLDGDGRADLLVGSPGQGGYDQGAVVLIAGTATGLSPDPIAFWDGGAARVSLGAALAIGDADGDGIDDAVLGGPSMVVDDTGDHFDPGVLGRGAVWWVRGAPGGPAHRRSTFPVAGAFPATAVGDVDGDGRIDLTAPFSGLYWQAGTADGMAWPPVETSPTLAGGSAWRPLVLVGCDVDGDGFSDVVGTDATDAAWLRGTPSGPGSVAEPLAVSVAGQRAVDVHCLGDLDGDGAEEFLVVERVPSGSFSRVSPVLWQGGDPPVSTGVELQPTQAATCGGLCRVQSFVAAERVDVNGDGLKDVVLADQDRRQLAVWWGGPLPLSAVADQVVAPRPIGSAFGKALWAGGDVDGDGFDDVLVAATSGTAQGGILYVVRGSPSGLVAVADRVLEAPYGINADHGFFGGVGDVDGDGFGDVLIAPIWQSAPITERPRPFLGVLRGGPSGLATHPWWVGPVGLYAAGVAPVGDADGDGFDDVVVVTSGTLDPLDPWNVVRPRVSGQGYLFRGGPSGMTLAPPQP